MPIVIGTVGQTTKEIIGQLVASKAAGADFGLVLTPSYFHFAMDGPAIKQFFTEVQILLPESRAILADCHRLPMLVRSQFSFIAGP